MARVACVAIAVAAMLTAGAVFGSRDSDAREGSTTPSAPLRRSAAARVTEDAVTAARLQLAATRRANTSPEATSSMEARMTVDSALAQGPSAVHSAAPSQASSSAVDSRPTAPQPRDARPSDALARLIDPFGRLTRTSPPRLDEPAVIGGAADIRWYNGRPLRPVRIERMRVTAYSPDERSCGDSADGITASGYSVSTNGGFLVAADPKVLALGSLVSVPGYDSGEVVPVLDVGGAIKGARLDVLFPTHEAAVRWGVRTLDVTIWEYADGKPNDFKRFRRPAKRTP